jgi:hypothetical protein
MTSNNTTSILSENVTLLWIYNTPMCPNHVILVYNVCYHVLWNYIAVSNPHSVDVLTYAYFWTAVFSVQREFYLYVNITIDFV